MAVTLVASLVFVAGPAGAAGTFEDDDGNVHESAIEKIVAAGIARGCNPPTNNRYCPDEPVTRGQMAAFLNRMLELRPGNDDRYRDDDTSVFESDIDAIARAGITSGCNPPSDDHYCPNRIVTRGEMAAFLVRALDLDPTTGDYFADDYTSVFEGEINALARVGITRGCNPPTNTDFCPGSPISRAEMATFLARAVEIHSTGTTSTSRPPSTTSSTTGGGPTTITSPPTTTQPPTGAFLEEDGVVVMEIESVPTASGWSRQSSVNGYTGAAYYTRTGASTRETGKGTLRFEIVVDDPGLYAVSIRSRRDRSPDENVENDQRNDVFAKMDSDQWWKATTHAAFGSWGWIDKKSVAHATFEPLTWQLSRGSHTFLISGRSEGIKIDRVHVYKVSGGLTLAQIRNLNPPISTPESHRSP